MESQPQNPKFRNNPENFHPCESVHKILVNPYPTTIFVQKMLNAFYVCYIYSSAFQTSFFFHGSKQYEP